MAVLHIVAIVLGTCVVLAILISALETVVLPQSGFTRIARFVFGIADRILVRNWNDVTRGTRMRGLYAPIALVTLPLVWMLGVILGFTFIFWGLKTGTLDRSFAVSGSSLTTLGFAEPDGTGRTALSFVEATIGLGLVALLISYLPTIYSAHNARERGVIVMRPFAGVPPGPVDMLANLHRLGSLDNNELWRTSASWMLDLDQTHTAFPALCYFPEAVPTQSWVASVGTLLDGSALLVAALGWSLERHLTAEARGPMLALAYGIPSIVQIGRAAGLPIDQPTLLPELMASEADPDPGLSITRAEFDGALDRLSGFLPVADADRERSWRRFAALRSGYDRALRGMAGVTLAPPAPWTTDRPAIVGRPRLLRRHTVHVDWSVRAPR